MAAVVWRLVLMLRAVPAPPVLGGHRGHWRAMLAILEDHLDGAERIRDEAAEIGARTHDPTADLLAFIQTVAIRFEREPPSKQLPDHDPERRCGFQDEPPPCEARNVRTLEGIRASRYLLRMCLTAAQLGR